MSNVKVKPGAVLGDWIVKVDGKELECRSVAVHMVAGEVPQIQIVGDALPLDLTLEGDVTFLDPVAILAQVWNFHQAWGDNSEADMLALWEDLGRILRGGGE